MTVDWEREWILIDATFVRWVGERLRISSDICFVDGRFVAEGPVVDEPEGADRAFWVHQQFEAAAEFFLSCRGLLRTMIIY